MTRLSWRQTSVLQQTQRHTDGDTPLHRSGELTTRGMVARGPTIRSLEKRGLVVFGGFCMEADGDGFAVTGNDDAPWWTITPAGRVASAEAWMREIAKAAVNIRAPASV